MSTSHPISSATKLQQLDWINNLRALAMFLVVILHTTSPLIMAYGKVPNSQWLIGDFYNALARFGVPVFVMITGALLLGRDYELGDFLRRRLWRIIPAFIFWSLVYIAYSWYDEDIPYSIDVLVNLKVVLHLLKIGASYHLWYVYMLIGLYFIIPILGKFVRNATDKEILYFLLLWLVVMLLNQPYLIKFYPQIDLHYITGYIGYLVLGYYLTYRKIPAWLNVWWFGAIFLVSLIVIVAGTYFASLHYKTSSTLFYEPISPMIVLLSTSIFMVFKSSTFKLQPKIKGIINYVGGYTYGIYLSHALILTIIGDPDYHINIDYTICTPIISIPFTALVCYSASFVLVWLLSKLPFVGKWIAM
jgi:surface polysaccharide O-acyltransferase-like enzyme